MDKKYRVLVAPLDWGLGHATRCVPIIKELIKLQCEVFIVADKKIFYLLKKEFPDTVFLRYKGYEIEYNGRKNLFALTLFFQFPKIIFSIFKEKRWINKIIRINSIDAIISDNRFGMYSKKIPSIYITHQLCIKTGNIFTDHIAKKIHNYFIKKYTSCWVPDFEIDGLAGELSHPKNIPSNVVFIGPLSRFNSLPDVDIMYDLLISISGPEPQRTIFENEILKQLKTFSGKVLLLRGLPSEKNVLKNFNSIRIINHLPADELNIAMQQSKIIISRSGYTTVMDLTALRKEAILIPTPGQKEQEYLAKYLLQKQYFFSTDQMKFSIEALFEKIDSFNFKSFDFNNDEYKKTIREFVLSLKSANFATQ
ncbi:MAG: glycosyltransferase [Ginsengibacter sp.]